MISEWGKQLPTVQSHVCNGFGKKTMLLTHCIPVVRIPLSIAFYIGLVAPVANNLKCKMKTEMGYLDQIK